MRAYKEIEESARDEAPFSNGDEGYGWMENWCWRPCHEPDELAWQKYEAGERKTPPKSGTGCPLLLLALTGKTPSEWIEQPWIDDLPPVDRYHCVEFRGPDDLRNPGGPRGPQPLREPDDMDGLFERPERRVRMLKQFDVSEVLVDA